MTGIIFLKSNFKIIAVIPDVQSVTETDCIGASDAAKGIDASIASIAVVASTALREGDTLGAYTDVRDQLPVSDKDKIAALEAQIAELQSQFNP